MHSDLLRITAMRRKTRQLTSKASMPAVRFVFSLLLHSESTFSLKVCILRVSQRLLLKMLNTLVHGVALSIIFRKQFTPVINPSSPSRIEHILKLLNVPCVDIDELDRAEDFNYDDIYTNIERERQRSIAYLKDAIE